MEKSQTKHLVAFALVTAFTVVVFAPEVVDARQLPDVEAERAVAGTQGAQFGPGPENVSQLMITND